MERPRVVDNQPYRGELNIHHGGIMKPYQGGAITGAMKWPEYVRKFARDHKMSYWQAIKDPKCSQGYRAQKYSKK